jgi:micrococcal nuclease
VSAAFRRLYLVLLAAAGLAAASLVSPVTATADTVTPNRRVLRVVDGDTIDIRDDVRGRLRVRILGIDTPETVDPGAAVGCWGPETTAFARANLEGQRVALVTDPTQDRTDRFGRTLAYLVRAEGWDYSVEAARAGAARSYVYGGTPVSRHYAIAAAEKEARDARRGLWARRATATPFRLTMSRKLHRHRRCPSSDHRHRRHSEYHRRGLQVPTTRIAAQREGPARHPSGRAARLSLRSRPRRGRRRVRMMH